MMKFKKIVSILCLAVLVSVSVALGFITPTQNKAFAEEPTPPELPKFEKTFSATDETNGLAVSLEYSTVTGVAGTVDFEITFEHNEEALEKFQKYAKKDIDAASVGEVFYVKAIPSDPEDKNLVNGKYTFKIKLPKFYHNKDVAVIPFNDYRTTQTVKAVTVDEDGYIKFYGNQNAYAYAIVYNGVYKQIILIGVIMLVLLIICVTVKIYCLRKDNPEYQEKKKQKAIQQKKEQHKVNRKLAQELKREKEKLSRKNW